MTAGRTVNSFSQEWCTPPKYVDAVRKMFHGVIEFDPCSNPHSVVHAEKEIMLPEADGLKEKWDYKTIYVNPPYGSDRENGSAIRDWLRKCADAHTRYLAEVLALVPVATNTGHWKSFVFGKATAICFLYDTRLKFLINGSADNKGAPMACCMVYWGQDAARFQEVFLEFGAVVNIESLINQQIGDNKSQFVLKFE